MIAVSQMEALTRYFEGRTDVAFAFLFGSQARGTATKLSDVDIAVYFHPAVQHPVEYEAEKFYAGENEVGSDLERILRREVELLVLNRVSASVAASALRGVPLAINDWGLYLDFMLAVTDEAEGFMDYVITDYRESVLLEKRG